MTITSSGSMTLEQIDQALAAWDSKRALASQNVIELMDHPTYKQLVGQGGFTATKLTGITESRCTPALKSLNELWSLFAEMGKVIDRAHDMRKAVKGLFKGEQLLEIEKLLTGPAVKVTTQVDFSKRSLLTPNEVTGGLTLDRVMDSMVKAYDEGKALIVEISDATERLQDALAGSVQEVKTLQATAQDLGEGSLPELDVVDGKVTDLINLVFSDPLGVQADFKKGIEPLLQQARDRVGGLKDLFEQIKRDLAHAHDTMTTLSETQQKAKDAFSERQQKVTLVDAESLPCPPQDNTITTLRDWLARLDGQMAAGKWKPLRMGVANWSTQATERLHACQTAYEENLKPLSRRQELREFLDILRTKAESYGRSEDEDLAKIHRAAKELLYTRPTNMAEAERLVNEYAENVR